MGIRVSVALAAYNSERFIRDQVNSILCQMKENDELVISYNPSSDATWSIINEYAYNDSRVRIIECTERGLISNFNSAITNTKGDFVFLSDHDDVWFSNKIELVLKAFEDNNADLVLHAKAITDKDLCVNHIVDFNIENIKPGFWSNFWKNHYTGACMAFRRELIPVVCPIPPKKIYHDKWIGLLAASMGNVFLLNEPLIYYRRHETNLSVSATRSIYKIIPERFFFMIYYLKRRTELLMQQRTSIR